MPQQINPENLSALLPLYKPWEEPISHRVPNKAQLGGASVIQPGRRPSRAPIVRAIRAEVDEWRRGGYAGVSQTSQTLLRFWFENDHVIETEDGQSIPFHYHWAQREAIETLVYLYELRGMRSEAELLTEFGGTQMQDLALGINPENDRWLKACCKVATGGGKTKIMSLLITWSYFHSLKEPDSTLARHFVLIAPNLTVYERLKDDFENCAIFYKDPLIPDEWKSEFQVQVTLQDDPGGATSTGTIYLTNIHRLYENRTGRKNGSDTNESIFGPAVARNRALDTGESLRNRISAHPAIMVLNDEAHHLHDEDLAWVKAIDTLDRLLQSKGGRGICLQADFTATPKHNDGSLFNHIICDFPLGEAVDAGIVKVPVLGEMDDLRPLGDKHTPAPERYRTHLQLGYMRYKYDYERFEKVRKPVLFVMTEDTTAANEVAAFLDSDQFPLLQGRVLNVHTKLKGRIKTVHRAGKEFKEFEENETGMKDDDLRALREMSRELDSRNSPYRCVVSVMMLREGWDVRNVTTIIPLRPYKADSGILPEQTLGRGLRRMFPSQAEMPEIVTVIEHPAFRRLYEEELQQEGLDISVLPVREEIRNSVTIFVDSRKPIDTLDIQIPQVSDSISVSAELKDLTFDEVSDYFDDHFKVLPIGARSNRTVEYRERLLFTDEVVNTMQLDLGLLEKAWSAASYFARELGRACHLTSPHADLTPLIERFLSEVLFEHKVDLYSGEVDHRMHDIDVLEYVRATFTPLIIQHTVKQQKRTRTEGGRNIAAWRPYQATSTPERPAVPGNKTLFNLVPCDNDFEKEFADFCEYAGDIIAYAKNAGPQKLMIDYLKPGGQRAFYVPDFFLRTASGRHFLVELKGRVDPLVPMKARAAADWCKTNSKTGTDWEYLYVPYQLFSASAPASLEELARACSPSLNALLTEAKTKQMELPLAEAAAEQRMEDVFQKTLADAGISTPPPDYANLMQQAVNLLDYAVRSRMQNFAHAFQPLLAPLDELALRILEINLRASIPADPVRREVYFNPPLDDIFGGLRNQLDKNQRYLKDNLVYGRSMQRIGTLLFCLTYADRANVNVDGVWRDIGRVFHGSSAHHLMIILEEVNQFRNTRVAHVEESLTDPDIAWVAMKQWLKCIVLMVAMAKQ